MMNLLIKLINNLGYVILIAFIISKLKVFKKILQKDEFKRSDLIILSLTFAIFGIADAIGALAVFLGAAKKKSKNADLAI